MLKEEMKTINIKRICIIGIVLSVLILTPLLAKSTYITHLFIAALMFAIWAMGFDISAGYLGILNFGFAGFIGLGAYTAGLMTLRLGVSPWISMLLGGIVALIAGSVVGVLTLRFRSKIIVAMFTWFFALTLQEICYAWIEVTGGIRGLITPPLPSIELPHLVIDFATRTERIPYYYLILVMFLLLFIALNFIVKSKVGLIFRAIREDEIAAEMTGVDTVRYKVLNMAISSFIAGLVGGFYCFYIGVIAPDLFSTEYTVQILTMTYVGGRGTLWGPVAASFLLVFLLELLRPLVILRWVFYGVLLIMVMIFFPKGISVIKEYIW